MDIKKILKNKKLLISLVVVILIIIFIIFAFNNRNDGMENINDVGVYYKVYTSDGWSKWSKNGLTSGSESGKTIKNIKIKIKTRQKFDYSYSLYNPQKNWLDDVKMKNMDINAIRMELFGSSSKKYDICYRVYNKKDKWLNWSCNYVINGNANENITAIQIKIVPRHAIKDEYLKDYIDEDIKRNFNFE